MSRRYFGVSSELHYTEDLENNRRYLMS